ncbi:hypothetical protein [Cetobacterium sp.]|uniref:hypothetical protein n=1 Tax=Cetobacterium sp. TaxID=2071632 RepID=UPI003F38D76D
MRVMCVDVAGIELTLFLNEIYDVVSEEEDRYWIRCSQGICWFYKKRFEIVEG